jgi:type II secretory pathway pseudopilin PulG
MRTASHPTTRPREGRALVELLVASALLILAGTGAARALVTAERAARRARETVAAEALVAARLDAWAGGACTPTAGERVVGTQRERWRVVAHDGLATLVDSVAPVDEGTGPRAGIVGVAPCTP